MTDPDQPRHPWLVRLGLGLVVAAYLASAWSVFRHQREVAPPGRTVLSLTHWQLEAGFREAMDRMIADYERLHPEVRIIQNPIPSAAYRQWVQTNLIGGIAPDLVQFGRMVDEAAVGRYCLPLSPYLREPNPYNAGNEFRDTPWIDTFGDGLKSCWNAGQMEYFTVGLNCHTLRMFYNRTLFRSLLGREDPPRDYEDLLAVCEQVARHARRTGQPVYPIAASDWQVQVLGGFLACSTLSSYLPVVDRNFDCRADADEQFISYVEGRYGLADPEIGATFEMYRRVAAYFPPGFTSLRHQDAAFAFTQGRALMISSGSWDAWGFRTQVEAAGYELGVFDFPLPGPDHPRYGRYYDGRYSESQVELGSAFAVNRASRHPEIALDFLRFMTAKENNERFSRLCRWIPSIRGARAEPAMRPFAPRVDGIPSLGLALCYFGDPARTKYNFLSAHSRYLSRPDATYGRFRREIEPGMVADGAYDFHQQVQSYSDALRQLGHLQGVCAVQAALAPAGDRAAARARHAYLADAFAAMFMAKQARRMEIRRAAAADTPRARALRAAPAYREFVDRFLEGNN